MRIGIVSDIHDNIWSLREVLARLTDCDALLCLGDLCAPFVIDEIAGGFSGPVHVVWGNNDGDKLHIAQSAARAGSFVLHGEFADINLGGRRIAMTHYPDLAGAVAAGHCFDLVCHGHDHEQTSERDDRTLLVNPGEVMGRFGSRTCAVYDTDQGMARFIRV